MLRQIPLILQIQTRGRLLYSVCKPQDNPSTYVFSRSWVYTNTKTAIAKIDKVAQKQLTIFIDSNCECPQFRRKVHNLPVAYRCNSDGTIKNLYPKITNLTRAVINITIQFLVTFPLTLWKSAKFQGDIYLTWGISKYGVWTTNSWRVDKLPQLPTSRLICNFPKQPKMRTITVRPKQSPTFVSRNFQTIHLNCWN